MIYKIDVFGGFEGNVKMSHKLYVIKSKIFTLF